MPGRITIARTPAAAVSRIRCSWAGRQATISIGLTGAVSSTGDGAGASTPMPEVETRKRSAFAGSATSVSTTVASNGRWRGPYSAAACTTPSAAAAASRHEAGCARSPSTGVAPRACTRAAPSLLRTDASTWCPPRTSASSTAAPTYPVPPVRNTRMIQPRAAARQRRVFHHNSGHMMRRTLLDFFADVTGGSAAHAEFLAYDDGYRAWTWTYGETAAAARAFAQRLRGHGIASGQAIAIWSENRPEWIAAMWGALLEGVVIVPIDYRTSADFLLKVAGIVDAKAIVAGDGVDSTPVGAARPVWKLAEIFRQDARLKAEARAAPDIRPETTAE